MVEVGPSPVTAAFLTRSGRIAAIIGIALAAFNWVGWATGTDWLTRIHPIWPPMAPWAALWLAALGVAILVQSG
ncbi:MAG: GGDEF domain-containing protein, partial [Mycobacterium sp.]